jgi:serine/threonine protein kinase
MAPPPEDPRAVQCLSRGKYAIVICTKDHVWKVQTSEQAKLDSQHLAQEVRMYKMVRDTNAAAHVVQMLDHGTCVRGSHFLEYIHLQRADGDAFNLFDGMLAECRCFFDPSLDVCMVRGLQCNFTRSVLAACRAVHDLGLCHGDIKLENILYIRESIDSAGKTQFYRFKLADLEYSTRSDQKQATKGTMAYMSPEAMEALNSSRNMIGDGWSCDVWAAGMAIMHVWTAMSPPCRVERCDDRLYCYATNVTHDQAVISAPDIARICARYIARQPGQYLAPALLMCQMLNHDPVQREGMMSATVLWDAIQGGVSKEWPNAQELDAPRPLRSTPTLRASAKAEESIAAPSVSAKRKLESSKACKAKARKLEGLQGESCDES